MTKMMTIAKGVTSARREPVAIITSKHPNPPPVRPPPSPPIAQAGIVTRADVEERTFDKMGRIPKQVTREAGERVDDARENTRQDGSTCGAERLSKQTALRSSETTNRKSSETVHTTGGGGRLVEVEHKRQLVPRVSCFAASREAELFRVRHRFVRRQLLHEKKPDDGDPSCTAGQGVFGGGYPDRSEDFESMSPPVKDRQNRPLLHLAARITI